MSIKIRKSPAKINSFYGKEGQALIANDNNKLRSDNIYPELVVKPAIEAIGATRSGWDKAIYSDCVLVNLVGKNYGVLPNIDFFGQIENKLLEKDISVLTRSSNYDNRSFCVEHILADEKYHVKINNGNNNDEIRPMLAFTSSYDGSTKTQGHFGFFRKICNNGLHVAVSEIGFSLKHRGNIIETVVPEIDKIIEKFMNNEFFTIMRKFDVLAETPIRDITEYVELICNETGLFKYNKSEENEEISKKAEEVISIIRHESKILKQEPTLWLGYNSFNNVLHNSMKKNITNKLSWDKKLFNLNVELANLN